MRGQEAAAELMFRTMRIRTDVTRPVGRCEAVFILVIEYDGVTANARLVTEPRPLSRARH